MEIWLVEFGAKFTMSLVNGYSFLDIPSWNPCHEGKFGKGKRKYGLGLIFTFLQKISETSISFLLLVMNLSKLL